MTVTVLSVRGNTVRIGVAAPRTIPVHREEFYRRVKAEQDALVLALPRSLDPAKP